MKRKILLVQVLVLYMFQAIAQTTIAGIQPVKVGEKLPDLYLANIVQYKKSSGKLLTDFGGKPLILDFWNTGCHACVRALPLMDSIQRENEGRLNILLVNKYNLMDTTPEVVTRFFAHNKYVHNVKLPSTVLDTVLGSYFPGEPYQAWINKDGIVAYISEAGQVNRENVRLFLEGKKLLLRPYASKDDPSLSVDNLPLIVIDRLFHPKQSNQLCYSYLSAYDSTSTGGNYTAPHMNNGFMHFVARNKDLENLYKVAYYNSGVYDPIKPYQLQFHCKDVMKYKLQDYNDARADNMNFRRLLYCYEYISKDTSTDRAYLYMQQDLDRFFCVRSRLVKQLLPCYIIRKTGTSDLLQSKGAYRQVFETEAETSFVNISWSGVMTRCNNVPLFMADRNTPGYLPYQLIDETGICKTERVDIVVPALAKWSNLELLNRHLSAYGLQVSVDKRYLDVIMMTD